MAEPAAPSNPGFDFVFGLESVLAKQPSTTPPTTSPATSPDAPAQTTSNPSSPAKGTNATSTTPKTSIPSTTPSSAPQTPTPATNIGVNTSSQGKGPSKGGTVQLILAEAILLALRENINIRSAYLDRVTQKFDLKVAEWKYVPKIYLNSALKHTETRAYTSSGDSVTTTYTDTASATPEATGELPTGASYTFSWNRSKDVLGTTNTTPQYNPHIVYYDDRSNLSSWAFTFSQPLLRNGGLEVSLASIKQAQLGEQSNIQGLKSTLISTVTDVITSYRNILQLQRQLRINQDALQRSKDLIETNKLLINAGRMAAIDLIQTESDVANKELLVQQSSDSLDTARLNLNKTLNLDRSIVLVPQDEGPIEEITPDFDACLRVAYANRPAYLQQVISVESAKISYMLAQNNSLWDLNAEGGYSRADLNKRLSPYTANTQWTLGLALKIPVFGDLSREQTLISARVNLKKAELSLEDLKSSLANDVLNATRDVVTKLKQLKLANKARKLSEQKLDVERLKLTLGRTSNFQVISYENDLRTSLQSELDATTNYRNALSSLDQLLGSTLDTWKIEFRRDKGYRPEDEKDVR
jgi:outer membrane protein TolC